MSTTLGFEGAPISGALLVASVASSLVNQGHVHGRGNDAQAMFNPTRLLAFRVAGELAIGSLLLHHARVHERERGSRRYTELVLKA